MSSVATSSFKNGLAAAGRRVCASQERLCALDAAAGDGDLGATPAMGFTHLDAWLETFDGADLGQLLIAYGTELARMAPSTIGTLLATAYMRAGKRVVGLTELQAAEVAALLEAAADGVAERGRAEVGQRTMLDAMFPSSLAAAEAAADGCDARDALHAAAVGARAGADATAQMEPQHGRAGWIKERARGFEDAGAVAWAIYVEGLAEGCSDAPDEI